MPASFAHLGVPSAIVESLDERGITSPFPIQLATIVDGLAGRDLCGKAPTGSGKTIAFGIPMVIRVARAEPKAPTGLVLVPTRELASQVHEELTHLARPIGRRVMAVYGGVSITAQVKKLARGVDIVVATPGRLLDLVSQRALRLDKVAMITLDEADRMADMGFMPDVKKILDLTADERQTLLFSATLDGDVDEVIRRYQTHPVRHDVTPDDATALGANVSHVFWEVPHGDRVRMTAAVIERMGPTIVFSRTKHGADRIVRQLGDWQVRSVALHGDKTQSARNRALGDFHDHKVSALVATDVAARGIHVDDVAAVVHFDPPADHKDYRHRSGRTGRAGAGGVVITLVTPQVTAHVRNLRRDLELEGDLLPGGTYPPGIAAARAVGGHRVAPGDLGAVPSRPSRISPGRAR